MEKSDSFKRWQNITLNHLSYVNNLVLGLATGLLAFQSTFVLNRQLSSLHTEFLTIVSIIFLSWSIIYSIWCAINRLCDFRLTAKIARHRERKERNPQGWGGQEEKNLQEWREKVRNLGACTWILLWYQLGSFGIGAFCSAMVMVLEILL